MILDFSKLHAVLERIAAALEGGPVQPTVEAAAPATRRPRGRPVQGEATPSPEQLAAAPSASLAASAAAVTSIAAAQTMQQTAVAAADPVIEKVITLQQVADAIIDLANNYSRDAAVAILAANNVKKVPELKPEQFAGVLAAVAKAKAPQTPASGSAGLF